MSFVETVGGWGTTYTGDPIYTYILASYIGRSYLFKLGFMKQHPARSMRWPRSHQTAAIRPHKSAEGVDRLKESIESLYGYRYLSLVLFILKYTIKQDLQQV